MALWSLSHCLVTLYGKLVNKLEISADQLWLYIIYSWRFRLEIDEVGYDIHWEALIGYFTSLEFISLALEGLNLTRTQAWRQHIPKVDETILDFPEFHKKKCLWFYVFKWMIIMIFYFWYGIVNFTDCLMSLEPKIIVIFWQDLQSSQQDCEEGSSFLHL